MQKQLEANPEEHTEQWQIELPISMGNSCNYCEQYTHASQEYKCSKVIKTEQSIYECLLGFCFNIFCAATNFGCIDSFLRLIPETKK